MKPSIKTYSYEELKTLIKNLGQPSFRADQLVKWLYQAGISDYDEMSNIPKSLRAELEENYPLGPPVLVTKRVSKDESRKYLIELHDGSRIETVGIPSSQGSSSNAPSSDTQPSDSQPDSSSVERGRLSVCVSTQVGCSLNCSFCATGQQGLTRSLLPGEIVDQVLLVQNDFGKRVSNVVFMGQGEPFLNYDNTLASLRLLNSENGLAIGARHMTVSTSGIITGIERFAQEPEQFTLAISLHAADQAVRDILMPALKNQPLSQLKQTLLDYQNATNRRFTLEYVMLRDLNDRPEDLLMLKGFTEGLLCHINLLPVNKVEHSKYLPSTKSTTKKWLSCLNEYGIETTLRNSRGSDIAGACGQLYSLES